MLVAYKIQRDRSFKPDLKYRSRYMVHLKDEGRAIEILETLGGAWVAGLISHMDWPSREAAIIEAIIYIYRHELSWPKKYERIRSQEIVLNVRRPRL